VEQLGLDHSVTAFAANNLAVSLRLLGRFAEALAVDEANAVRFVGVLRVAVAEDLCYLRELDRAYDLISPELGTMMSAFGADDDDVLIWQRHHVVALHKVGRTAEATTLGRDLLDRGRRLRGPEHPQTVLTALSLSNVVRRAEPTTAHDLAAEALDSYRRR